MQYVAAAGARRSAVQPRWSVDLGPGLQMEVLHAHMGSSNEKDNSVVLRVQFGATTLLLGGDCEAACEASFVPGPAQVYKVLHHGSGTSSSAALLGGLQPYTALISAGAENQYSPPTPGPCRPSRISR